MRVALETTKSFAPEARERRQPLLALALYGAIRPLRAVAQFVPSHGAICLNCWSGEPQQWGYTDPKPAGLAGYPALTYLLTPRRDPGLD